MNVLYQPGEIESFFIKRLLVVGLSASLLTAFVELIERPGFGPTNLFDFLICLGLFIGVIFYLFKKIEIGGIIAITFIVALMCFEIAHSLYLKPGSLSVILVIGLVNSVIFQGRTRWSMQLLTFLALLFVFAYLISMGVTMPEGSTMIATTLNVITIFGVIVLISSALKSRYDHSILRLNQLNEGLEKKVEIRTKQINDYKDHLEEMVKERTEQLESALEKLKKTQTQLIQSEKMASVGLLSAGVAHELANPLNYIQGSIVSLKGILNDNRVNDPMIDEHFTTIEEGIHRSSYIIQNLGRISRQKRKEKEVCQIHEMIDRCLQLLKFRINDEISITKVYTRESFTLFGNEGELHQVIMNVLANAIQAMGDQGTLSITSMKQKSTLELAIKDSGVGITENDKSRVFDPFYTTKEPGEGTGLGLYISYSIIQEHGGTIEFDSSAQQGTTVTIRLPVED